MPPIPSNYALDANVFIQAHRRHYAFSLCPGFWDCLPNYHSVGRLISIDKVRDELRTGDPLDDWARHTAPSSLFASTADPGIQAEFASMMRWVQSSAHYLPQAKSEFARVADGWLAAFAKAKNYTLVTHEEHDPLSKKRVPLPTLCLQFGVPYLDTFSMLKDLGARFVLST